MVKHKSVICCVLMAALMLSIVSLGNGCSLFGGGSGQDPIPRFIIDEDFVKLVEDAMDLYIKDPDKAKAAQLILRLVVYIAKKINESNPTPDSKAAKDAKALQDKVATIPADGPERFEKSKELGQEAVAITKTHVRKP